MTLTISASIWAALALIVLGLAVYRRNLSSHEDDTMHLSDAETGMVSQQVSLDKKLEHVDRWGKLLTIVVLIYGLALAGVYLYNGWLETSRIPN